MARTARRRSFSEDALLRAMRGLGVRLTDEAQLAWERCVSELPLPAHSTGEAIEPTAPATIDAATEVPPAVERTPQR